MTNTINFYRWENGELSEGWPITARPNKRTGKIDMAVVVGNVLKGRPVGKFSVLPLSKSKWPTTSEDKRTVLGGSIKWVDIDGRSQRFVQTIESDDAEAIFVWVKLGLKVDRDGDTHKDLYWRSQTDQVIMAPLSLSFDGGSSLASGEEELTEKQATQRKLTLASPDHPLLKGAAVRDDVYRIPRGGSIGIREVNGTHFRIANENNGDINVYDAAGMAEIFSDHEKDLRKEAKKRHFARKTSETKKRVIRQERESNPTSETVDPAPAEAVKAE